MSCTLSNFPAHDVDRDQWCWAACAEMVLEWMRLPRDQVSIVRDRYGDDRNRRGWPRWDLARVPKFAVACEHLPGSVLEREICAEQRPVMIVVDEHAVVAFGFDSAIFWGLRVIDPGIFQGAGARWSRWSWVHYRFGRPITTYEFGAAANDGPTDDLDEFCRERPFLAEPTDAWHGSDLSGEPIEAEVAKVLQLYRSDGGEVDEGVASRILNTVALYRQVGPREVSLDGALVAFTVPRGAGASAIAGALRAKRLSDDVWIRATAQVSEFSTALFGQVERRIREKLPLELLEVTQGRFAWIRRAADGNAVVGSSPLPGPWGAPLAE